MWNVHYMIRLSRYKKLETISMVYKQLKAIMVNCLNYIVMLKNHKNFVNMELSLYRMEEKVPFTCLHLETKLNKHEVLKYGVRFKKIL